jgi:Ni/Co efflux regulator RcnB
MKYLISAAIALTLLGSPAALAQRDNPSHQGQNPTPFQNNVGPNQGQTPAPFQNNSGPGGPQGFNQPNRDQPHWSRGDRLSADYRSDQYFVSDWRGNHLRKPKRGHRWVHVNNRYMLVKIGNGLILEVRSQ